MITTSSRLRSLFGMLALLSLLASGCAEDPVATVNSVTDGAQETGVRVQDASNGADSSADAPSDDAAQSEASLADSGADACSCASCEGAAMTCASNCTTAQQSCDAACAMSESNARKQCADSCEQQEMDKMDCEVGCVGNCSAVCNTERVNCEAACAPANTFSCLSACEDAEQTCWTSCQNDCFGQCVDAICAGDGCSKIELGCEQPCIDSATACSDKCGADQRDCEAACAQGPCE